MIEELEQGKRAREGIYTPVHSEKYGLEEVRITC
jgi:hypothetical protein